MTPDHAPLTPFLRKVHETEARNVLHHLRPVRALTHRQLARRQVLYGAAFASLSDAARRLSVAPVGDDKSQEQAFHLENRAFWACERAELPPTEVLVRSRMTAHERLCLPKDRADLIAAWRKTGS